MGLVFSAYGLVFKSGVPDDPKFTSVSTDWLNPWNAWCAWDQSHSTVTGCYGTSYFHFGGPYSLFWYWMMGAIYSISLPLFDSGTVGLLIINAAVSLLLLRSRKEWILSAFMPLSSLFVIFNPQDTVILLFLTLGFWWWPMVFVSLGLKLPLLSPVEVWRFVISSPTSASNPANWTNYVFLTIWGLLALGYRIKYVRIRIKNFLSGFF